jgi:hypothetical protein
VQRRNHRVTSTEAIGDVQLELIQQLDNTPCIYTEFMERGARSVHHYAVLVEDFDAAFEHATSNRFTTVVNAGMMVYVESERIPGLILEIIASNDFTRPYFGGIGRFLAEADPAQLKHDYNLRKPVRPQAALSRRAVREEDRHRARRGQRGDKNGPGADHRQERAQSNHV